MSLKIWQLILCLMIPAFIGGTGFAYTTEQAVKGKALYVKYCAVCHGVNGEGGSVPEQFGKLAGKKVPPLAGPGYLPGMKTAGQAYETAKQLMPLNNPGSLKADEYLEIISFALQANGVKPDGQPLTPASAKKIKLAGGEK
jgi:S-disulfanyl-L-cysteine oxidoreductase SoxD